MNTFQTRNKSSIFNPVYFLKSKEFKGMRGCAKYLLIEQLSLDHQFHNRASNEFTFCNLLWFGKTYLFVLLPNEKYTKYVLLMKF